MTHTVLSRFGCPPPHTACGASLFNPVVGVIIVSMCMHGKEGEEARARGGDRDRKYPVRMLRVKHLEGRQLHMLCTQPYSARARLRVAPQMAWRTWNVLPFSFLDFFFLDHPDGERVGFFLSIPPSFPPASLWRFSPGAILLYFLFDTIRLSGPRINAGWLP